MSKTETCRVCLQTELNKCISLFDNYKNNVVSEHIKSIAAVEIEADDELPQGICTDCLLQLDNALEFKRKCELSDQILRNGATEHELDTDKVSVKVKLEISVNNPIETIKEENKPIKEENESTKQEYEAVSDDNITEHTEYLDIDDVTETNEVVERKSRAIDLQLICDDCGGSFKSKCKLRVHWKKVHLAENLVCHLCKRIFKSFRAFNVHKKSRPRPCLIASQLRIEGEGKTRIFHCTHCSYKHKDALIVHAHLPVHSGEKNFHCNICGNRYTQYSTLLNHKDDVHHGYKYQITCHVCGKQIFGRNKAYKHMQRHKAKNAQCKVCNKVFKSEKYLANHMVRHTGVKAFTCEICGTDFYTNNELITHRRMKHKNGKMNLKYKCDLCEFRTSHHHSLVKHSLKHTDTNVPCLICGNFFDDAEKFAKHKKLHDENKYSCTICFKKYATAKSLGAHVRAKHKDKEKEKSKELPVKELKQENDETK